MVVSRALFACIASLSAAGLAAPALAQFNPDPGSQLAISDQSGDQPKVRLAADGTFSISYLSSQATGWDTWVQRLSGTGMEILPHQGIMCADSNFSSTEDYGLAVDAAGNTMVAFRDNHTGTTQIALQKVAPDGSLPWGPWGVTIPGTPPGSTDSPHTPGVVCTSDGGYVVRFSRGMASGWPAAMYQKVDAGGNLLWNAGQAVMIAPAQNGYFAADMAPSDNGSVIAFLDTVGSFSALRQIWAIKLDGSTGASLWNQGTPLQIQTSSTMQIGYFPQVISDGSNGALVAWYEVPNGSYMCKVQRVGAAGNLILQAGGLAVASSTTRARTSPAVAFDPATQAIYMIYTDGIQNATWSVFGQMFDSEGTRQWGEDGLRLTPDSNLYQPSFERLVKTPGGVIGAWFMATNPSGSTQIVQAAMVTDAGALPWPGDGTIVVDSNSLYGKSRMDAVGTPDGAAVVVYGDGPMGSYHIVASRINPDGTLGSPVGSSGSCCTNNTCTITTQAACAGTWTMGATCNGQAPCGPRCGSADFNCDGAVGTDADIESFFACLSGSCPGLPCISSADFNGDGAVGTDADIESFFRVLAGGPC
jgi:hypothetical protein